VPPTDVFLWRFGEVAEDICHDAPCLSRAQRARSHQMFDKIIVLQLGWHADHDGQTT
jgi:hypothetical protein